MRLFTNSAALATLAFSLAVSAAPAMASDALTTSPIASLDSSTNFDLGVDVSNVPPDVPDVYAFLSTLAPDGQAIMQDTCANYVTDPGGNDIRSPDTLPFCRGRGRGRWNRRGRRHGRSRSHLRLDQPADP
jgi:hypothetical protein